jgi:two-component system C4-dicarboxylate transport response regulator DctD
MKQRILLVEDDEIVGPLVQEMLCLQNYDVVLTRGLQETEMLTDYDFSAIIADLKLVRSNGCDVIAYVRRKTPGIPALLISGYGPRVTDVCAQHGIEDVGFLAKPFTLKQLMDTLSGMPLQSVGKIPANQNQLTWQ